MRIVFWRDFWFVQTSQCTGPYEPACVLIMLMMIEMILFTCITNMQNLSLRVLCPYVCMCGASTHTYHILVYERRTTRIFIPPGDIVNITASYQIGNHVHCKASKSQLVEDHVFQRVSSLYIPTQHGKVSDIRSSNLGNALE